MSKPRENAIRITSHLGKSVQCLKTTPIRIADTTSVSTRANKFISASFD
jgi:hypothetical protein